MSRSSDQEHHKADTGGSPDVGDRRPCPFNEVVAMDRGGKTATTRRSEVIGSFTSSRVEARRDQGEPAEISTLGDQDENEGVVLGAGEVDDPSLAVPDFLFLSSIIKIEDLMVQSGVLRLVRRRRWYSAKRGLSSPMKVLRRNLATSLRCWRVKRKRKRKRFKVPKTTSCTASGCSTPIRTTISLVLLLVNWLIISGSCKL
ncbi:hypothetical protein ACOSQ4_031628 [Xanthoceras sorbifolium]